MTIDSVVYRIPCGVCASVYYGESGRGLPTRLKEHKADLRHHRLSNALVAHAERTDHLPNWTRAAVVHKNLTRQARRTIEAAYVTVEDTLNMSASVIRLAGPTSHLILNSVIRVQTMILVCHTSTER